ncbi:hypothetical protein PENSPDRAFT_327422 [Peniophora sp. CONT]|nr:hypothetical protein PENSPDRAFT_327422 [Peniophora sp. CONT]
MRYTSAAARCCWEWRGRRRGFDGYSCGCAVRVLSVLAKDQELAYIVIWRWGGSVEMGLKRGWWYENEPPTPPPLALAPSRAPLPPASCPLPSAAAPAAQRPSATSSRALCLTTRTAPPLPFAPSLRMAFHKGFLASIQG